MPKKIKTVIVEEDAPQTETAIAEPFVAAETEPPQIPEIPQIAPAPVPVFLRDGFDAAVEKFFSAYPAAQKYKREIAEIICQDAAETAPLENAYIQILSSRFRDPAELLSDDGFIETRILTDKYILQKLKAALIRELSGAPAPATLTGGSGAQLMPPVTRPKNLTEAAQMTERYLSGR